ncbi:MAG: hypothetical protein SGCHY_004982 [Lobulomycetales sp.]
MSRMILYPVEALPPLMEIGPLGIYSPTSAMEPRRMSLFSLPEIGTLLITAHSKIKEENGLFASRVIVRPVHCVRDTLGAEIPHGFPVNSVCSIVSKGTQVDKDAYSGFDGTDLDQQLKRINVSRIYVIGYCTEYCVSATAHDAKKLGYDTHVIRELCAPVNKDDASQAVEEMRQSDIIIE